MVKILGAKPIGVLAVAVLVLVLSIQTTTASLGLGEARVESYLGQALQVRIALLEPSPDALDSLTVEIASPADHARLGVPVDALSLDLRVEIDRSTSPPVLRVRSSRPADEPFVQLLINARWASGRMLREYTLFLDPPTVPVAPPVRRVGAVPEPAASPESSTVVAPAARPAETRPTPTVPSETLREAPRETTREAPREPARPLAAPSSVAVRDGQTLWSIASAWRSDESVSMSQVMLAILESNPEAFADNNVNRLRRGAVLSMPDIQSVRAIAPDVAERRVREQNATWRASQLEAPVAGPAPPPRPEPLAAPPEPETVAEPSMPEPPPVPEPAAISDPETETAGMVEALEQDLGAAPEAEPLAAEDPDLLPRLELTAADEADLLADDQAIGVERERLEQQLAELVQELRADGVESPEIDATVDQIRQAIDSADAGGFMVASESLAWLEAELREARLEREQAASEPTVLPTPAEQTASGGLQPFLMVAALIAVVLLLAGLLWRRSRRRDEADTHSAMPVQTPLAAGAAAGSAAAAGEQLPDALDAGLSELYRLAEEEDHEAFGSALSSLHAQLDSTDDPRWREAVSLARIMAPGHPLLLNRPEDLVIPELDTGDRDLMDMLTGGAEQDFELPASADSEDRPETGFADWLDEQDRDFDNPDLARVTNRLDPEEISGLHEDRLLLPEDEQQTLFAAKPAPKPSWEQADDEPPLDLDFEFSLPLTQPLDPAVATDQDAEVAAAGTSAEAEADEVTALELAPPAAVAETPAASPAPESSGPDQVLLDEFDLSSALDPQLAGEEQIEVVDPWFDLEASESVADDLSGSSLDSADQDGVNSATLRDDDAEVKLDLARAYLSMDDADSARALLEEILADGSQAHRAQAQRLLDDLD